MKHTIMVLNRLHWILGVNAMQQCGVMIKVADTYNVEVFAGQVRHKLTHVRFAVMNQYT